MTIHFLISKVNLETLITSKAESLQHTFLLFTIQLKQVTSFKPPPEIQPPWPIPCPLLPPTPHLLILMPYI